MSVLQCRSLTKNYGSKPAIKGINLDLPEGKIIGLLGPNGSGKTTLIKLIAGLLTIDGGEILVDGQPVSTGTNSLVSYLPERTYLNDSMTVMELIKFFEDFYTDFDRAKAMDMMARLNIEVTQRIKTMSKGTKEKVQLIMVMSRNAKLYLLDEPIGGVDPAARDYILNTIIGNYAPGATVIISTHLIQDVEKVLDEVIFINQGNIVLQSSVDDIREKEGKSVDTLFREEFRC
ncbi:MAG: ABC transporter ATP-binding protein [Oscillospiraceae bacterium]